MPAGQAVEPLDRRVQQLGVGREGDVLGLHRGVDRDPRQVPGPQRAAGMRHPQALGQQQLQLVAEPLPPVAQVRALVREGVLEELLAGEVLEIRIIDPALAHAFVGQPVDVLEQQQPDHKAGLDARAGPCRCRAARSRHRSSPSRSCRASCTSSCFRLMIWSSRARNRSPDPVVSCFFGRIVSSDAAIESLLRRPEGIPKRNRKVLAPSDRQTLQSKTGRCAENRFASIA